MSFSIIQNVLRPPEILLRTPSGDEISFARCNPAELGGKKFLPLTNSSGVSQALEIGAIKAAARNGIYTASVSPAQLLQYSDGSLSSIIKEGGRFSRHAGFLRANGAVFTPVAAMQVLSFVTGQYFFVGLNRTLNEIRTSLTRLENLDRAADWGCLFSCVETLRRKREDPSPATGDLMEISRVGEKARAIANKYFLLLSHQEVPADIKLYWTERKTFSEFLNSIPGEALDFWTTIAESANFIAFFSDVLYQRVLYAIRAPEQKISFSGNFAAESFDFHQEQLFSEVERIYKGYIDLANQYSWKKTDVLNQLCQKEKSWDEKISSIKSRRTPAAELSEYLARPRTLLLRLDRWGRKTPFIEAEASA